MFRLLLRIFSATFCFAAAFSCVILATIGREFHLGSIRVGPSWGGIEFLHQDPLPGSVTFSMGGYSLGDLLSLPQLHSGPAFRDGFFPWWIPLGFAILLAAPTWYFTRKRNPATAFPVEPLTEKSAPVPSPPAQTVSPTPQTPPSSPRT